MTRKGRIERMHDRGLTYEEIGQVEGISKQRVASILKPYKVDARTPLLLTMAAAAAYLGIHINTLRRWADEGKIECMRLANTRRDRRFSRQQLDKVLEHAADTAKGGEP